MPHVRLPEIVYAIDTVPPPLERAWTEQPGSPDEWTCVDIVSGLEGDGIVSKNALAEQEASTNIAATSFHVPPSGSPIQLRYYQTEAIEAVFKSWDDEKIAPIIILPTGCHRAGQRVIMLDGSAKAVEDVIVGDKLLGPDHTPRTVLQLCRGTGPMVTVTPESGAQWTVNDEHILTVLSTRDDGTSLIDLTVREYECQPAAIKARARLWRTKGAAVRFSIERTGTIEAFFGFTLDRDHRYLLDDFTVTHNSGKTLVAAEIMRIAHEGGRYKRPVFVAHRQELLDQTVAKVRIMAPNRLVGLVQAERNEPDRHITIASIQTIGAKDGERLAQIIAAGVPQLLICDEAHHATADSYQRVIAAFRAANPELRILGLTATPGRSDGTSLDRIFDCVAYQKTIYEMIREGFLVQPIGVRVTLDISLDVVDSESGEFVTKKLSKIVDQPEVTRHIVNGWLEHAQDRKTIAFCITKQHAANIAAEFISRGVPAAVVNEATKTKERKAIFQKFREGHIKVMCSVEVLTEGFDEPSVECILMARPTQSQSLYVQAIGRGLRLYPGKENCLVIDCTANSAKYSLAQLTSLTGLEPPRPPGVAPPWLTPPTEEEEEGVARVEGVQSHALDFRLRKREAKYAWREVPKIGWALQIPKLGYFLVAWHNVDHSLATVRFHDMREGKRDLPPTPVMANPIDFEMAYGLVESEVQRLLGAKSSRARLKDREQKDAAPDPFAFLEDGLEDDARISEVLVANEAEWRTKVITQAQRDFLEKKGIKPAKMPATNGEASDLIGMMIVENDIKWREPATSAQLYYLRMNSVVHEKGITKNAAKKLILGHKMGKKS